MTRGLLALAFVALLAGCAPAPPPLAPLPPGAAVQTQDLRGTWAGTWAGSPLMLVVTSQQDVATSDVTIGPWPIGGHVGPGITGVLTYAAAGRPTSVNVTGRLGGLGGRPTLVLQPAGQIGQFMTLTVMDSNRLIGMGRSHAQWDPEGPVELVRQAPR
jgi:hypothetical protein